MDRARKENQKQHYNALVNMLERHKASAQLIISKLDKSNIIENIPVTITNDKQHISIDNAVIEIGFKIHSDDKIAKAYEVEISCSLVQGTLNNISIQFVIDLTDWSKENYVLMPGAVYDGNRFGVSGFNYPPIQDKPEQMGENAPTLIADIPRLNIEGNSKLQLHAGDMATPAFGYWSADEKNGLWIITEQGGAATENGFSFYEDEASHSAFLHVSKPGVKNNYKYRFGDTDHIISTQFPSDDTGMDMKLGDNIILPLRIYSFDCPKVQNLFDVFFEIRSDLFENEINNMLPFGKAWEILENAYNDKKWVESSGYYSMGNRLGKPAWILGWPGMMMYPMILDGSEETRHRAKENIDFVLTKTQAPTGFFYGSTVGTLPIGDYFPDRHRKNWGLIRRNADGLFYLVKCLMWFRRQDWHVPEEWEIRLCKCADAFVRLWQEHHQIGQFVDLETGDVIVGGSSSGVLSIGALALCGMYFEEKLYIDSAQEIGDYYYHKFVEKGITNGGPGEIMQAPDSESSYAMLESFINLYETTKDNTWLERAEEMVKQFATWCVSYDYEFPPKSEFARLGVNTTGSVIANAQNKHSAPGICTHSGFGLLRLFIYTGNAEYLKLIGDIAHSLPQYISTHKRSIRCKDGQALCNGCINERVNMSDWEGCDAIGEVFFGDCWCSTSMLMTCAEIPGVVIQPDTGLIHVIDHIEAKIIDIDGENIQVSISNTSSYDTNVKILCLPSKQLEPLKPEEILESYIEVSVCAGGERMVSIAKP